MRLLTSYIHGRSRRAMARFIVVGVTGTILQYGIYDILLRIFPDLWLSTSMTIAFVCEAFTNYALTSFYTFSTRPTKRNAGGFIVARAINYVVQIAFLQLCLLMMGERMAGISSILLAGIANFVVLRLFFRKPAESNPEQS